MNVKEAVTAIKALNEFFKTPEGQMLQNNLLANTDTMHDKAVHMLGKEAGEKVKGGQLGLLRNIAGITPGNIALQAAGAFVPEALRAGGNIAMNNANALATALLQGQQTEGQRRAHGRNLIDEARGNVATARQRNAQNVKAGLDAVANTVEKTLGAYNGMNNAARSMAMGEALGRPMGGLFWNYLTQTNKRMVGK